MRWWKRRSRGEQDEDDADAQAPEPRWIASSIPERRGVDPPPRSQAPDTAESDDSSNTDGDAQDSDEQDGDTNTGWWEGEYYEVAPEAPLSSDELQGPPEPRRGPPPPREMRWGVDPPPKRSEGHD